MTRRVIKKILEKLSSDYFTEFQRELEEADHFDGQEPLVRSALENKDRNQTTDLILQTYPNTAVQIVAKILEEINRKDLQKELLDNAQSNGAAGSGPVAAASVPGTPKGAASSDPKVDFVNKHKRFLIQRVTAVEPILDLLVDEGVMKNEDYSNLRAEKTSQGKIRGLFVLLDSRGAKAKRVFYKGLEENESYLMDDLNNPE